MILAELLRELRENVLHDRSNQVGDRTDYLWSDTTLIRYIDEAQRRLAREGLVIWDAQSLEATRVSLREGISEYALHPSIIVVLSARLADSDRDLVRTGHTGLNGYQPTTHQHFGQLDPHAVRAPGRPVGFTTDETLISNTFGSMDRPLLRVWPVPDQDMELRLRVVRLPLQHLIPGDLNATPEVPSEHHLEMLDWAAYLALRIADVDAGLPQRAKEFRASFEDVIRRARKLRMRRMMSPTQWAFGRNGFAWEQ